MIEAWKLNRNTVCYQLSFASSLKLAWSIIRSKIKIHYTKARGVSYQAHQKLLYRLEQYPKHQIILKFVREPDNAYDSCAIAIVAEVINKGTAVIGYLSSRISAALAPLIDKGKQVIVYSFYITGGKSRLLGCNITYFIE